MLVGLLAVLTLLVLFSLSGLCGKVDSANSTYSCVKDDISARPGSGTCMAVKIKKKILIPQRLMMT